MGDKGGGTQTVVQQQPAGGASVYPEAREGFNFAQQFFKNVLTNPPTYPGPRLASVTPAQGASINQAIDYFGGPQPYQTGAENQVAATTQGNYLGGPGAQAAVSGLAAPLFARFNQETLPGIRDRAQLAGQGVTSSRRQVAESNAINDLGRSIGQGAIAPIYTAERQNMLNAAGMTPSLLASETARIGALRGAGEYERSLGQQQLDVAKQIYEEPFFRQAEAAQALGGLAGFSPGGTISRQNTTTTTPVGDQAMAAANTALLAAAVGNSIYQGKA